MALLDWIDKGQGRPRGITKAQVKQEMDALGTEYRQDERLGKLRDAMGREPEASELPPEPKESSVKQQHVKPVRVNSRDVPF